MKKSKVCIKLVAAVMVIAMLVCVLASCSSSPVMTLKVDGKTYTVTQAEYSTFMKIVKMNVLISFGYGSVLDSFIWTTNITSDQTYDEYYTDYVYKLMQSVLIEKYLADRYGLEFSAEKLASYSANVKALNQSYGSAGSYKMYFGYTAQQYYDYYVKSIDRSELLLDYLYKGDNAIDPVTDDDKETYYTDNYRGYMYIYLDMNNAVQKIEDEDGTVYYVGLDSSDNEYKLKITTDEEGVTTIENVGRVDGTAMEEGKEVTIVSFKTYKLESDEDIDAKAALPDLIMQSLEAGEDFQKLALQYSDDYYTYLFEKGVFVANASDLVNNESVTAAMEKLEVGEHTDKLEVSDSKYVYIIKRVDLIDDAYDNPEYKTIFTNFESDIMYSKYDELVNEYREKIVADTAAIEKFNMKDTFVTAYVDDYKKYTSSTN
ncbi:MAG: hypothetical protein J5860_05460 [Clostridia bacterium]|nr:hypothetical protein [Clostridia bacterium]